LVATKIASILDEFLAPWAELVVSAPAAIIVRPKTELQPDVMVFRRPIAGRFKWEDVRQHLLAVEVMSRSTRVYDRDYKRPAYLALGVKEMWRVDPDEKVVYVSRAGSAPDQPCRDVLSWSPSGTDATLTLPLSRIFRGIDE
jgi:Uma2 family endonuclease